MWAIGHKSGAGGRWRRQHRIELDAENNGMWPLLIPPKVKSTVTIKNILTVVSDIGIMYGSGWF